MVPVRQATPTDAPLLARMLHDFNTEFEDPSPGIDVLSDRVAEFIANETKVYLLGGDGPDGFAQVDFIRSVWSEGPVAHLDELYVVPERRGRGTGKALMAAMLEIAEARGAAGAEVVTGEDDTAARGLYESFGFENEVEGPQSTPALFYELNFE